MSEVNEDVIYRCKCGAEIEWRITTTGVEAHAVAKTHYRNLAASLLRLTSRSKSDRFRIRLATMSEATVVFSRKPGSRVVVISDGKRTTFGRLDLDTGEYVGIKALEGLQDLLTEADYSLRNAAIRYGLLTEQCSFCGRHLSARMSMLLGYGRICAEHHDLPWGGPIELEKVTPAPMHMTTQRGLDEGFHYKCACGGEIEWRIAFGVPLDIGAARSAAA